MTTFGGCELLELNRIYNMDCMEGMDEIKPQTIDAIITDPPYMINTKSDGQGKLSPWADYCNGAWWYTAWIKKARKILKPTGCLWTFLNWRSFVTFQKAICDARWSIESVLVWDKCWIGPGGDKGLRPSYELVALLAMPEFKIEDRGLADIQRFKWSSIKPNGHPAEKPISLMRWLITNSTKEGQIVCDLFVGSGTTCAAAIETNRQFIGFELDKTWYDAACKRIEQHKAQIRLFDIVPEPTAEQMKLI